MPTGRPDDQTERRQLFPKVSVVVPVYNPGPYLERCVDSILGQSLPPGELEAIFVDDGSTDGSGARLDELAAAHPHVRVIHQENSGWPGKPRNVGIDAARGEYVFFLDNDDALGPEALERLHAMAVRNGSDIVLGKMVGRGRSDAAGIYRRNVARTTLAEAPFLIGALTPHKLFRRAFLEVHGLRFPEGKRRLEDQVFVVEAYFAAAAISVVADYPCYQQLDRADRGNASRGGEDPAGRFDPRYYYPYVREVLDVVVAHTEPGPFRDHLLRRFANREVLARLRGPMFLRGSDVFRAALLEEVKVTVERYIPPTVDDLLKPPSRAWLALLRAGRDDLVAELAVAESGVAASARARSLAPTASGAVELAAVLEMVDHDQPLCFVRDGDRLLLPLPGEIASAVPDSARVLTLPNGGRVRVTVRRDDDRRDVTIPVEVAVEKVEVEGGVRIVHALTGTIPPVDGFDHGALRPGRWDLVVRLEIAGYRRDTFLRSPAGAGGPWDVVLGDPPHPRARIRPVGRSHRLVLDVGTADWRTRVRLLGSRGRSLLGRRGRRLLGRRLVRR